MERRLRVAFITIHPAPYRDPTLELVYQRGVVDIEVVFLFGHIDWHPYWEIKDEPSFPSIVLGEREPKDTGARFTGILRLLRQRRYDVVFISGYQHFTMLLALSYCIASNTPFVFVSDSILQGPHPRWKWLVRYLPVRLLARTMSAAWVPGRAARDHWVYYGVQPERIFEGCYCIDAEAVAAKTQALRLQRSTIRGRFGFSDDQLVFLFVGRMIPTRGLQYLMEAFRTLTTMRQDLGLILVGDGPVRPWVEDFVREQGLDQVRFVDPVPFEVLPEYYVACDAYVHPSIREPYSLAVAQTAISARPLILTGQVGAAADYLVEGRTGYLAKAGSAESLCETMRRLIANKEQMIGMGCRAQDIAMKRTALWAATQLEEAALVAAGQRPLGMLSDAENQQT